MMKKDMEWLRRTYEEVKNKAYKQFAEAENGSEWETINNAINSILKQVLISIDQLDEPEVLSQEWIDEHKVSRISNLRKMTMSDVVPVDELQDLLVPKSEVTLDKAFEKVSQSYPMTKEEIWKHLEQIVTHGGKVTYGESEVLSQEWIERNTSPVDDEGRLYIWKRDLENLLVPKQEELESKIKVLIEAYKQEDGAYSNPENGWIGGFVEDLENLVEEVPLYRALIKGYELLNIDGIYWTYNKNNGDVLFSNLHSPDDNFSTEMSKAEWNKLGINDSNAHFVKVDE